MDSGDAELYRILSATLEADKAIRAQAEEALNQLSTQHPDLVVRLLRFATQPAEALGVEGSQAGKVLLAAAIRIRNVLGRSDWNRSNAIPDGVKEQVREGIVPLQCAPHVEEHIRRQLLSTTSELLQYDYPARWSGVVPQVSQILESCMLNLSALPSGPALTPGSSEETQIHILLLRMKGALGVLRYCCKIYDDPLKVTADQVNEFATAIIPSILTLWEMLLVRWEQEAQRVAQQHSLGHTSQGVNPLELAPALTELSHCLRLSAKCLWSLTSNRWPKLLCAEDHFSHFFTTCLQRPTEILTQVLLPIFRRVLEVEVERTKWYGDRFSEFQEASVFRLAKWIGTFMHKLIHDFSLPKQCEKRARPAAKLFVAQYLPYTTMYSLELVRWHSSPVPLNSKAFIMALECLTLTVVDANCYTNLIVPAAEELMTVLLFPRFAFSTDDAELWNLNPEEYVRKQSSPAGDLFNPKVVSVNLLISLAVPSAPFHDNTLVSKLVDFIVNQLAGFSERASQTAPGEPASPEMEAARRVDAAMYCLYQLKRLVKKMAHLHGALQDVLLRYVVPATRYPIGFLRARAVQVLSVYSSIVQWTDPQSFQQALSAVLPLLQDAETPVQVQTCVSFSLLLHHPYAYDVINPCIANVVQQYFNVMRMIDNEAVVRTLQKTIRLYSSSLCQWAVELTEMITQHFFKVAETVTGKYITFENATTTAESFAEEDNFVDVLMTADELLETLTILIKSLPLETATSNAESAGAAGQQTGVSAIMLMIQERVAPLLYTILSYQGGSAFGFMDCALRLLTTLLSRSPSVVPGIWRLIPCLYQLVVSGAADYFGQMLAPLDNYSSVEPVRFVMTPFLVLCPEAQQCFQDATMMQWTPAQVVLRMGDHVFQADSLRLREKSSVPKICDSFLQNYWWAVTQQSEALDPAAGAAAAALADAVTTVSVNRLTSLSSSSPTMKVLLANAVFSAMLADARATAEALSRLQMLPTFFQSFCSLVSQPDTLGLLRGYDRRLVAAAVAEGIRALQECRQQPTGWTDAMNQLDAALQGLVESQMLQCFAAKDAEEVARDLTLLQQHQKKKAAAAAAGEDSEEWESEEDDEDEEDGEFDLMGDDGQDWMVGGEDDDEDDEAHLFGTGAGDEGKLASLIEQAQKARKGGKQGNGDAYGHGDDMDGDMDDADDNLLDEEDMESPVLDKLNVWMALAEVAMEAPGASAAASCLVDTQRIPDQWSAVLRAKDGLQVWNEAQNSIC